MDSFANWLKSTPLSSFVVDYFWVWPASETLHFIGLALLVGIVGTIDLRLLGVGKGMSLASLHRLLPWAILGFIINLITGILFFAGDPFQYVHNPAFQMKMLFILLAGMNVLVFYLTVFGKAGKLGAGDDAPMPAKVIAAFSLFLWIGVMYWGRMLPFIGQAF